MALFFHSFRHNTLADSLGLPKFALSKNELRHQMKYDDDTFSMSGDLSSFIDQLGKSDRFAAMDLNRIRRQSILSAPPKEIVPDEQKHTEKRSNMHFQTRDHMRNSLSKSFRLSAPLLTRTTSDVNEVTQVLALARHDFEFNMKIFHRKQSGELIAKVNDNTNKPRRSSLTIRKVSGPMEIFDETRINLGKVHYQLAVLHGMGRFPDIIPESHKDEEANHDAFSVLFHLCHAASLHNVPGCLALGRLHAGLGTAISPLLDSLVPIDFDAAKDLLKKAMDSELPPAAPKVAAGCILYQIYLDEEHAVPAIEEDDDDNNGDKEEKPQTSTKKVSDLVLINLLTDILNLMSACQLESEEKERHKNRPISNTRQFHIGDRVVGNYFMEGTFYPGVVDSMSQDGTMITVKYDDDGSTEALTKDNVRLLIPPTATQTNLGGPLSDEEALGMENSDEKISVESYQLRAELAELIAKTGDKEKASSLYEEASCEAMSYGKMKTATEWSLKASTLLE
jgi:elongation factor 2 kinase